MMGRHHSAFMAALGDWVFQTYTNLASRARSVRLSGFRTHRVREAGERNTQVERDLRVGGTCEKSESIFFFKRRYFYLRII